MGRISVLHLSHFDNAGGSGRSAYKIHCGLRRLGFDSKMLVRTRVTNDADVGLIRRGWLRLADKLAGSLANAVGWQYGWMPSSKRLLAHPWYRAADVVQLYNIHGNYFSPAVLPRISSEKPIVWRLSDMWPLTGHCAHAGPCGKWRDGCHSCPRLDAYPALKWDTAARLWKWKRRLYQQSQMHVVAPSRWIEQLARQSPLLGQLPISIIRNGIDCELFRPQPQQECRRRLAIAHQGRAVLFLAANLRDPHKGTHLFLHAVRQLAAISNENWFVMLVGSGAERLPASQLPCPVWRHGKIDDDRHLALVYGAADVIVHSATAENLPNSLLEAMSCGRPAVAFDVGGIPEVVRHRETGALASVGNTEQLAQGIRWVLADADRWGQLSRRCRQHVLAHYRLEQQTAAFAELYRQLLHRQKQRSAA